MSKAELRFLFRAKRSRFTSNERLLAAQNAARILQKQPIFTQSKKIACYLPYKDEFDTLPIIQTILAANKECYLPVLSEPEENSLFFVRYHADSALQFNRFAIREPTDISEKIPSDELELVILPLLAFDRVGNRLGTGGGYYDRTFAFLHAQTKHRPHLLGLGFAIQQADVLPSDEWDIKLNSILTEKKFVDISNAS